MISTMIDRIEQHGSTIAMNEYIEKYRNVEHFLGFCRECKGYGKTWACPPFESEISLERYKYANLFCEQIWIKPTEQEKVMSPEELKEAIGAILTPVRLKLDERLLALEATTPNSHAFFAGSCQRCPKGECTRPQGLPCAKPHEMRPSLEAMGFDVGRSASEVLSIELQWCSDKLPSYFTLVYGLFTEEPINL